MNNIQKAFKTKSKLRGMADGGQVGPRVLGSGMTQRAGSALQGRRAQLDAAIDAASGAPPRPAPTVPVTAAPAKKPEEKSALRSFFGLADGGSPADVDRIMNSRDTSIFTPQEMKTFNAMGQAAMADAAQMQDVGVQAGQAALAAARPAELPAVDTDDMAPPEIELADGGKVKGKGGPTDDKVGPVALSDGEYVLPADTVEIVGRDKLDALRLATHDFVDDSNKPKVSGLRKMANGGPFYVDPEGVASRQMPPGRAVVPYQPPGAPSTAIAAPRAPIEGTATRVPPTAGAANPAATSSLRTAVNSGGGRAGSFVRGALPVAAISGALESGALGGGDLATGYRDKFNESIGATGPVSSVAGDAARVMGNVGDAITFGLAGRLGRGLSNLTSGQSFTEGFMSESDRDKYNREQMQRVMGQQAPAAAAPQSRPGELPGMSNVPADVRTSSAGMPATPVQPQSYQSRRLAEMGVPVDQQNLAPVTEDTRRSLLREGGGTPGQYVNLGSYGGDTNIYGTASKPGGRIDTFTGVGASARPGGGPQEDPIMGEIRSALRGLTDGAGNRGGGSGNAREINERYDKLASQLSSMYGPKGQGNLARRLLELEQSRSGALDADARNQSAMRGQDMQASTAANSANLQARMQALQTLGTMANQRSTQSAQAQAAQLKALQDAQKQSEDRMEDNAKVFEHVADTFAAGDKDKQSQYRELLSTLPPELHAAAQGLAPEDKRAFYTNIVRQRLGRNEGPVLGRDAGATIQNAAIGGLIGRMARFGGGAGGKAVDNMLGKIPRIGPALSALRPVENLARFGTLLGAAGGAYATPEVENLTRWDPVARDPETGAALPARADLREAATYGVFDTYLNPFDDSVQTVSGRRADKPTPDEEEAARRFRSALRD